MGCDRRFAQLLLLFVFFVATSTAFAATEDGDFNGWLDNNRSRGFRPDVIFAGIGAEQVNPANGNMTFAIPIGPAFPINSMSFQLTLRYNSKTWQSKDYTEIYGNPEICTTYISETTVDDSNGAPIGLGWTIDLGRIYNAHEWEGGNLVLRMHDGSERVLYETPAGSHSGVWETWDNTYLTIREVNGEWEGQDSDGNDWKWDEAGWFKEKMDPHGNYIRAEYAGSGDGKKIRWIKMGSNAGGECYPWEREIEIIYGDTNNEDLPLDPTAPHLQPALIAQVRLPAFGGGDQFYTFQYENNETAVGLALPQYSETYEPGPLDRQDSSPDSYLLKQIVLPNALFYEFGYDYERPYGTQGTYLNSGMITSITYPTGASVEFKYTTHMRGLVPYPPGGTGSLEPRIPEEPDSSNCPQMGRLYHYISEKKIPAQSVWLPHIQGDYPMSDDYVWRFEYDPSTNRTNPGFTVIKENPPHGPVTLHEFNVSHSEPTKRSQAQPTDGLTKCVEVYEDEAAYLDSTPTFVRRTDQAYRWEIGDIDLNTPLENVAKNTTTWKTSIYKNASPDSLPPTPDERVERTNYVAYGHYQHEEEYEGVNLVRKVTTTWNVESGTPADNHFLNTYSRREISSGGLFKHATDFTFSSTTGVLEEKTDYIAYPTVDDSTQTYSYPGASEGFPSQAPAQVRTVYQHTSSGESGYSPNGLPSRVSVYRDGVRESVVSHRYCLGMEDRRFYRNPGNLSEIGWNIFDRKTLTMEGIDWDTGLVAMQWAPDGRVTELDYDNLYRVKRFDQDGQQLIDLYYHDFDVTPSVSLYRGDLSTGTELETYVFDSLGRLGLTEHSYPGVDQQQEFASKMYRYDSRGRKVKETQWDQLDENGDGAIDTTYDEQDRPLSVHVDTEDGEEQRLHVYDDTLRKETVTTWNNDAGSNNEIVHEYFKDSLGRLVQVLSPTADGTSSIQTDYVYDFNNNLIKVTQDAPGDETQERLFVYDSLGRMIAERVPERDNQWVYYAYDARGNVTHKRVPYTNGTTLHYSYDAAARLVDAPYVQMTYDEERPAGNVLCRGKLTTIESQHIGFEGASDTPVETRRYFYQSNTGGITKTEIELAGMVGTTTWEYGYDAVTGLKNWISYPTTDGTGSNAGPGLSLALTYDEAGALTKIRDATQGRIPLMGGLDLVKYEYNKAGQPRRAEYANGIYTNVASSIDRLWRTKNVVVQHQYESQALWSSGEYDYDASGNVSEIGNNTYSYNLRNELETAYMQTSPGEGLNFAYAYDDFGNMLSRTGSSEAAGIDFYGRAYTNNRITTSGNGQGGQILGDFTYNDMGDLIAEDGRRYYYDKLSRMFAAWTDPLIGGMEPRSQYYYNYGNYRVISENLLDNTRTFFIRDENGSVLMEYTQPIPQEEIPGYTPSESKILEEGHVDGTVTWSKLLVQGLDQTATVLRRNPKNGIVWDFNTDGYHDGWHITADAHEPFGAPLNDEWEIQCEYNANDRSVIESGPVALLAENYNRFTISMTNASKYQKIFLYWKQAGSGWSQGMSWGMDPCEGGTSFEKVFDLSQAADWTGLIERFKIVFRLETEEFCLGTSIYIDEMNLYWDGLGGQGEEVPEYSFLHQDHLGTTRIVTDGVGILKSRHKYYPFGFEPPDLGSGSSAWNTRRFTGHERDYETGFDYMLARYYSSGFGRFLSVDPVDGNAEDVQSWNSYTYVSNNPLRLIDPDGRQGASTQQPTAQQQLRGMIYSEIRGITDPQVANAVANVVMNRVNSTENFGTSPGGGSGSQEDRVIAIIHAPNQFQGVGNNNYNNAVQGSQSVSTQTGGNAADMTSFANADAAATAALDGTLQDNTGGRTGFTTNGTAPGGFAQASQQDIQATTAGGGRAATLSLFHTNTQHSANQQPPPPPPPPPTKQNTTT